MTGGQGHPGLIGVPSSGQGLCALVMAYAAALEIDIYFIVCFSESRSEVKVTKLDQGERVMP